MENNTNNNDNGLYYDTDKAVEFIFSRLSKELKERIDKDDIYEILDIETEYMTEVGIIIDDDDEDDDYDESDGDNKDGNDDGGGGNGEPNDIAPEYDSKFYKEEVMVN